MTPDDEDDDDDGRQDASHYSPSRHSVNRCVRSHLADAFTRDARDAWHTVAAAGNDNSVATTMRSIPRYVSSSKLPPVAHNL